VKALVTGSAGFIGSAVVAQLADAGYEVSGLDIAYGIPTRTAQAQASLHSASGMDAPGYFRHGQVRFDVAVHCAVQVVTTAEKASAGAGVAANLEIDAALFQWAARTQPGRLVYFSSSCVYPADRTNRTRWQEPAVSLNYPERPDGLYGWAKLTGEQFATELAKTVPVTVVRPFSVYGRGVREGFAVRGLADQVRRHADPVMIWGDDQQTRDYIHVTDVARAVVALVRDGYDGPVNLGTGRATTLRDLAIMLASIEGYQPAIETAPDMPTGVPYLVADPARLRKVYEPRVALEKGLTGVMGK
jgi:nucleoside-diphosphate-sugar epimerase